MTVLQAVFFLLAIILLVIAAVGVPQVGRVSLVILAAAFALFAFVEPGLAHALGS